MARRLLALLGVAAAALLATGVEVAALDLGNLLTPPAGGGWVETSKGDQSLPEGPLSADDLARLSGTTDNNIKAGLSADGFVGAYARSWVQHNSQRVLLELVRAFHTSVGAEKWYSDIKQGNATAQGANPLQTADVPHSFGIEGQRTDGRYSSLVFFQKGNDVFYVLIVDPQGPAGDTVVGQARSVYLAAPEFSIKPAPGTTPRPVNQKFAAAQTAFGFLVFVMVPLVGLFAGAVIVMWRETDRATVPAPSPPPPLTLPPPPPASPAP